MKDFLLALFLSKIIALTPQPVDILGTLEIRPTEPIEAITSGASIEIEVSHLLGEKRGIDETNRELEALFPAGTIEAELHSVGHQPVTLRYEGKYAWSGNTKSLILSGASGVPTGVEFSKVVVTSHALIVRFMSSPLWSRRKILLRSTGC